MAQYEIQDRDSNIIFELSGSNLTQKTNLWERVVRALIKTIITISSSNMELNTLHSLFRTKKATHITPSNFVLS